MAGLMPTAPRWWAEWGFYVTKLQAALKSGCAETDLHGFLTQCADAYAEHLRVSSAEEALTVISGYGCSAVEIALMWVGRWRPTSAIVLVYSAMGMDPKGINKEYQGIKNRDFINVSPLSEKQLSGLSSLQKHASQVESDISQQVAMIQMLLVEQNTVAALRLGETCSVEMCDFLAFQQVLDAKLKEVQALLQSADNLRVHTLRMVLELLTPLQATYCFLAAHKLMHALQSFSLSKAS